MVSAAPHSAILQVFPSLRVDVLFSCLMAKGRCSGRPPPPVHHRYTGYGCNPPAWADLPKAKQPASAKLGQGRRAGGGQCIVEASVVLP